MPSHWSTLEMMTNTKRALFVPEGIRNFYGVVLADNESFGSAFMIQSKLYRIIVRTRDHPQHSLHCFGAHRDILVRRIARYSHRVRQTVPKAEGRIAFRSASGCEILQNWSRSVNLSRTQ